MKYFILSYTATKRLSTITGDITIESNCFINRKLISDYLLKDGASLCSINWIKELTEEEFNKYREIK